MLQQKLSTTFHQTITNNTDNDESVQCDNMKICVYEISWAIKFSNKESSGKYGEGH